jgi:hypothetical protein
MQSLDQNTTLTFERLEFSEAKMFVKLENLFAYKSNKTGGGSFGYFKVVMINGELHLNDSNQLQQDVRLITSAHDSIGRVLGAESIEIKAKNFFGFDTFSVAIRLYVYHEHVSKVRIYCTPSKYA